MVLPAGVALRKCLCFWREGASACTHAYCERALKRLGICTAADLRRRTCESGLLMLLSGAALAVHFSLWVEGIENTTHHACPLLHFGDPHYHCRRACGLVACRSQPGESSCTDFPLAPLLAVRGSCAVDVLCPANSALPLGASSQRRSDMAAAAGEIAGTCARIRWRHPAGGWWGLRKGR